MKWKIGNVQINNQVGLAPMAGISNPSYMKICEQMGVGWAVSELISAEAVVRNNKKTLEMLDGIDKLNIPIGVQIFGSNPEVMAKASQIISNLYHIAMIDINMGCPVAKVAIRAQAGSALLKEPLKIKEILNRVVSSTNIPITVKIRSGWDKEHINAVLVAKICEEAGAAAITIHPRTRMDGYSKKADWSIIKKVKENVKIPVIGNGDITNPILAKKMLDETGCDAIMIGRAALGNPWIFKETVAYLNSGKLIDEPSFKEKLDMIRQHFNNLKEDKNEKVSLLEIRTHALYYLKGMPQVKLYKDKICKIQNEKEFYQILDEYEKFLRANNNKKF